MFLSGLAVLRLLWRLYFNANSMRPANIIVVLSLSKERSQLAALAAAMASRCTAMSEAIPRVASAIKASI